MKIFIFNLLVMFNLVHASDMVDEWQSTIKTSLTKGLNTSAVLPFIFKGFIDKSLYQQGIPQRVPYWEGYIGGIKAIPTVMPLITGQFLAEEAFKKYFKNLFNDETLLSTSGSMFSAWIFTPLLAVFNGKTMGLSTSDSLRRLINSPLKTGIPILAREFFFLQGFQLSQPLSNFMQEKLGKNWFVKNVSLFATGFLASTAGYPFDTLLTWKQRNVTFDIAKIMKGYHKRGMAIGGLVVGLNALNEIENKLY